MNIVLYLVFGIPPLGAVCNLPPLDAVCSEALQPNSQTWFLCLVLLLVVLLILKWRKWWRYCTWPILAQYLDFALFLPNPIYFWWHCWGELRWMWLKRLVKHLTPPERALRFTQLMQHLEIATWTFDFWMSWNFFWWNPICPTLMRMMLLLRMTIKIASSTFYFWMNWNIVIRSWKFLERWNQLGHLEQKAF